MADIDIQVDHCRTRQQRLLAEMQRFGLEAVAVQRSEHVQWLAGPRYAWTFEPAAVLWADGRLTLVAPNERPPVSAADDVVTYEAQWLCTLRNDQRQASSVALLKSLVDRKKPKRVGIEFSCFAPHLSQGLAAEWHDIEPTLFDLRRRKEPDEMARLRRAIAATGEMYARAREIVLPGISELEVFNELQATAVESLGEMLTGAGNDYASGEMGGPPRDRAAQDGDLYILDLGPACRGYFADNCRTLAVNHRPTDEQRRAADHVCEALAIVQRMVRPGVSCREVFTAVAAHLETCDLGEFPHHLGHGIGLFPHEAPHLNPLWDDTFRAGDVFTAEPGLYGPKLRAGIRLENDYLVTPDGVELLSDFPLGLS